MKIWQKNFQSGQARQGTLTLAHGTVQTPVFMPVGTCASVKSLTSRDLHEGGASILLGNTFHLFLRPGMDVIKQFGGLHHFMGWSGNILSDSGGFQIFSLGKNVTLDDEGAHFINPWNGSKFFLTPEMAVSIQETLGSDIHMVLDQCLPYPATWEEASSSWKRSLSWAKRCRSAKTRTDLAQFGIVQGGLYEDLRRRSAQDLMEISFEGYAIGGLSVGEPKAGMRAMTALMGEVLPADSPRYLMGVGTPWDLVASVALGVDMFDCVMPTRNGRNGMLFTSQGIVRIKQTQHRYSQEPLDPQCSCYGCKNFTKGYLRHLFMAKELTGLYLLSLHNVVFYLHLMEQCRQAIATSTFDSFYSAQKSLWESQGLN